MKAYRILSFFIMIVLTSLMSEVGAQMCQRTGNVEVAITPESSNAVGVIGVEFQNYNKYQVTVSFDVVLCSKDGKSHQLKRVVVLQPSSKRSFDFSAGTYGLVDLLPARCSVNMVVEKCD